MNALMDAGAGLEAFMNEIAAQDSEQDLAEGLAIHDILQIEQGNIDADLNDQYEDDVDLTDDEGEQPAAPVNIPEGDEEDAVDAGDEANLIQAIKDKISAKLASNRNSNNKNNL